VFDRTSSAENLKKLVQTQAQEGVRPPHSLNMCCYGTHT
jgi:hypothetical protein